MDTKPNKSFSSQVLERVEADKLRAIDLHLNGDDADNLPRWLNRLRLPYRAKILKAIKLADKKFADIEMKYELLKHDAEQQAFYYGCYYAACFVRHTISIPTFYFDKLDKLILEQIKKPDINVLSLIRNIRSLKPGDDTSEYIGHYDWPYKDERLLSEFKRGLRLTLEEARFDLKRAETMPTIELFGRSLAALFRPF